MDNPRYKLGPIDVPDNDPFAMDGLQRRELVNFLSSFIRQLPGPFVLALDSPWGTGKTTLVRMLMAKLKGDNGDGIPCLYLNAWEFDYIDPFVALVSLINGIETKENTSGTNLKEGMGKVRKVAGAIAKRAVLAGVKAGTCGFIDLEPAMEAAIAEGAKDAVSDIFDQLSTDKIQMDNFRGELEKVVALLSLSNGASDKKLVIFIDELDRCRPTFAIEMLERIKHFFDIPGIIFVLSIDRSQIEASTAAIYGLDINAREYLRRFIDLDYSIPTVVSEAYIEDLINRFGLSQVFEDRMKQGGSDTAYDKGHFVTYFCKLSLAFELSLRACERCMSRLCVVLLQTHLKQHLEPILVALLIVLKSNAPNIFQGIIDGNAAADTVFNHLESLPKGKGLFNQHEGRVLFACLLAADKNKERVQRLVGSLNDESYGFEAWMVNEIIKIKDSFSGLRYSMDIMNVAAKIDLAARFR